LGEERSKSALSPNLEEKVKPTWKTRFLVKSSRVSNDGPAIVGLLRIFDRSGPGQYSNGPEFSNDMRVRRNE
jgi:hypothetical protein